MGRLKEKRWKRIAGLSKDSCLAREFPLAIPCNFTPTRDRGVDDCPSGGQRLRGYRVSRRYRSGYVRVSGRQAGRQAGRQDRWTWMGSATGGCWPRVRVTESYIYREKGKLGTALQSTQPPRLQWCAFGSLHTPYSFFAASRPW